MAKTVTDPNVVPGGPAVMEAPAPEEWAAPTAGEAEAVELHPSVEVRVMEGHPTRQVPLFNSKGKQTGWETVLDKQTQFAQPRAYLAKTAHHACLKGQSGKVLVYAETGVLLARFNDRAIATRHLKACGIQLEKLLACTAKLRGRDIRQAVPADQKAA